MSASSFPCSVRCAGALALLAALGGLEACGPSVQAVYEGSIRFEHCYRLDLDTRIVPSHRHACWQEWLQKYTYGQRRDHLEYAQRRVEALASGDTATLALNVGDHKPAEREFYVTVPAPTSAYVAPPPVAPTVVNSAVKPPGHECTLECEKQWQSCERSCEENTPTPAAAPSSSVSQKPVVAPRGLTTTANSNKAPSAATDATSPAAATTKCVACATDYRACVQRCLEAPTSTLPNP